MFLIVLGVIALFALILTLSARSSKKEQAEATAQDDADRSEFYRTTGRLPTNSGTGTSVHVAKVAKREEKKKPAVRAADTADVGSRVDSVVPSPTDFAALTMMNVYATSEPHTSSSDHSSTSHSSSSYDSGSSSYDSGSYGGSSYGGSDYGGSGGDYGGSSGGGDF